jgi:uncharacterized membrane protein
MGRLEGTALLKHLFNDMKEEWKSCASAAAFLIIALTVAFYKGGISSSVRMAIALIWLFFLPGYFILLRWRESLSFLERIVAGSLMCAGVYGIISYYLGITGVDVKIHAFLLPPIMILAGILMRIEANPKDLANEQNGHS